MQTRILAFAGHKQAGKTTCSNFLHGYQLRANGVIDGFDITTDGKLVIKTAIIDDDGKEKEGFGLLETNRLDAEFAEWAVYNMWPFIKNYSFATPLKDICIGLFGLQQENIYGNNSMKNANTFYRWEDMPSIITDKDLLTNPEIKKLVDSGILHYHQKGKMTHREFLQFFGTDICRKIYEDIWYSRLLNDINHEQPLVAIVDDCRFINEVNAIQNAGGKVIYLTRNLYDDSHSSEAELKECNHFDATIDNQDLSIHETNIKLIEILDSWGWLGKEIIPNNKSMLQKVGGIHKIKE
jgi:hypothetical protein